MRSLVAWVLATFLSAPGIVVLAALDSSPFLWLPFGLDAAVIVLTARADGWRIVLVPLLATVGSSAGAVVSYWLGRKGGEQGLERLVPPNRLKRVRQRLGSRGPIGAALLGFLPPPFPVTAVLLAAGALGVRPAPFLAGLAVVRLVRYGVLAWLARLFGPRILAWLESPVIVGLAGAFIALAVIMTTVGLVKLARGGARRSAAPVT